jgi:hypothetical protein
VVVVRIFRARVHPGKEGEFERFVIETGAPMVGVRWTRLPFLRACLAARSMVKLPVFITGTSGRCRSAQNGAQAGQQIVHAERLTRS